MHYSLVLIPYIRPALFLSQLVPGSPCVLPSSTPTPHSLSSPPTFLLPSPLPTAPHPLFPSTLAGSDRPPGSNPLPLPPPPAVGARGSSELRAYWSAPLSHLARTAPWIITGGRTQIGRRGRTKCKTPRQCPGLPPSLSLQRPAILINKAESPLRPVGPITISHSPLIIPAPLRHACRIQYFPDHPPFYCYLSSSGLFAALVALIPWANLSIKPV